MGQRGRPRKYPVEGIAIDQSVVEAPAEETVEEVVTVNKEPDIYDMLAGNEIKEVVKEEVVIPVVKSVKNNIEPVILETKEVGYGLDGKTHFQNHCAAQEYLQQGWDKVEEIRSTCTEQVFRLTKYRKD